MGFSNFTDSKDIVDKYQFPNECTNKKCAYMTEDGCKFEFCAFEEYPKLETEVSRYECELCGEIFERDNKLITHHICDTCIGKLRKSVKRSTEDFTCKICGGSQTGKESEIPESDICDHCFRSIAKLVLIDRELYDEPDFNAKWGDD